MYFDGWQKFKNALHTQEAIESHRLQLHIQCIYLFIFLYSVHLKEMLQNEISLLVEALKIGGKKLTPTILYT